MKAIEPENIANVISILSHSVAKLPKGPSYSRVTNRAIAYRDQKRERKRSAFNNDFDHT